jgi:chromosome condensin MukBEF ATPase and DNA-binding subunit MukB
MELLEGAKSLSSNLDLSRASAKELSKSIENVQKEATDVAVQRNIDRRRELRENEVRKELFLKRVLIQWEHEERVRREEAQIRADFLRKYGKRWAEVEALKAKLEKQEKEFQNQFNKDLNKARNAQFWCFAIAGVIAYFLVWGGK